MELFEVEIKTTIVVIGHDAGDAYTRAKADMPSIKSDEAFDVRVVKSLRGEVLPPGWDGMCVAYGDADGIRIKDL